MNDTIDRARALLCREGGLPLDDFITRLIRNQEAALDCLETLEGPRWRCSACGVEFTRGEVGSNEWYDHLSPDHRESGISPMIDLHAKAKDEFKGAVCGGK